MPDYLEKFQKMRVAGRLAAKTLDMLTDSIKPGVTTEFIDKLGYEFIRDNGGYSAPLYYRGFTKSLCTSLNHVVCHGININKYRFCATMFNDIGCCNPCEGRDDHFIPFGNP